MRVLFVALIALLFWWPQMSKCQNPAPNAPTEQATGDKKEIPPTHVIIEEPIPTIHTETKPNDQQDGSPEKPLPRFVRPEWVIVYITAVYVFFTILMWIAVKRQVKLMDQQRQESNRSSVDSLTALNRQITALEGHVKAAEETAAAAKEGADAARRNTDVPINSQWAWVVVHETIFPRLMLVTPGATRPFNRFEFVLKNCGGTVARTCRTEGRGAYRQVRVSGAATTPLWRGCTKFSRNRFSSWHSAGTRSHPQDLG